QGLRLGETDSASCHPNWLLARSPEEACVVLEEGSQDGGHQKGAGDGLRETSMERSGQGVVLEDRGVVHQGQRKRKRLLRQALPKEEGGVRNDQRPGWVRGLRTGR